MKDGGANGLEAPRAPPKLKLNAAKAPALAAVATPKPVAAMENNTLKWNTKNLSWRLGADMVSAASAAVLVAPIISIIDRYHPHASVPVTPERN
jgi:hypothetical protein